MDNTRHPQPQPHSSVDDDWEHKLRRYLLLLASLAATVTYAAGLDPPGGSWVESDGESMAVPGNSILRATNHGRYLAFYYSNATAFAASLIVILQLLVSTNRTRNRTLETIRLHVLRLVMVLDLLALMVAYTTGSCREEVATVYTMALVAALSAYVGFHILVALHDKLNNGNVNGARQDDKLPPELEQLRKVLMLLAIFAVTITYDAGLKPPGGFWEHNNDQHQLGEVILKHKHGGRFAVFFYCNTTAFIASLFTVVLLLDKKLTASAKQRLIALCGFVLVTLVALVAAYAAGSCRKTATTTYTVALVAPVLISIFLAAGADYTRKSYLKWQQKQQEQQRQRRQRGPFHQSSHNRDAMPDDSLKEKRSLVLLLATLAASITYQAGLNPPGGVWLENQQSSSFSDGHNAGDPILLNTDFKRYIFFFYCNTTAFVASVVVILMVQINTLLKRNALCVAMILDLLGLLGAYIAGSSPTLRTSVHLIVLAAAFLVYVTGIFLHVMMPASTPDPPPNSDAETSLKKRRKRLLLFAILMASITYQAGIRPPGGFWVQQGHSSAAGSPILEEMYPRRYQAFFYCNAISFMASIALIILLQNNKTYQPAGIRFYGLYACMLVGMLVLMGAYAAGTARRVRTSIYVFVLVGGVSVFIAVLLALFLFIRRQQHQAAAAAEANPNGGGNDGKNDNNHRPSPGGGGHHAKRKYVMLLAMLAASVTYQAGLDPPGGVWSDGQDAGSSVLHDSNLARYHVFFYSNSSSFVASIVVIILLLQSELRNMSSRVRHGQQQQELQNEQITDIELHNMPNGRHGPPQQNEQRSDEPRDNPLLLMATNTVVALDLAGLLVAYAAGSSRTMDMSLYVIVLVVAVVIYIVVHVRLPAVFVCGEERSHTQDITGERLNGANGDHAQAPAIPSQQV